MQGQNKRKRDFNNKELVWHCRAKTCHKSRACTYIKRQIFKYQTCQFPFSIQKLLLISSDAPEARPELLNLCQDIFLSMNSRKFLKLSKTIDSSQKYYLV